MSKEHAYAYEAGYRDGSTHYELEHCPACKNVADLQEALDENAKLRELATLMYTYHHGDCYSCKWHDECCNELVEWKCIAPERIDEMACELGIEVDE